MRSIVLIQREHSGLCQLYLIYGGAGSGKVMMKKRFDIRETEC